MAAVDLSTHPGHLARRLQQAHHLLWNAMVSEEITSPQFAVLNALIAEPGLDQRGVGERVRLDRSTVADVVGRLTRRDLLDKVRDPQDGRRALLRLYDVFNEESRRYYELERLWADVPKVDWAE